MRPRPTAAFVAACCALALLAAPVSAKDKPRSKREPPKTGMQKLDLPPTYVQVSVPADYDPDKWYPLLWILHPDPVKPEVIVGAWAETALSKTWILASRHSPIYDNEETIKPLMEALEFVKTTYSVDDRRIVLAGHNAGALMGWRLWSRSPETFAGMVTFSGEIADGDRSSSSLKALVPKPVYLFRGALDSWYTQKMLERDTKLLDSVKLPYTVQVQKDWSVDFPRGNIGAIAAWVDGIWPPGAYREKADAARKAIDAKELQAANAAVVSLRSELKRSPYPAFDARADALHKELLEIGRTRLTEAKRLLDNGAGLPALEAYDAAVVALKGIKPLDAEAAAGLAAAKKNPAVQEALRKKEAESTAALTMGRAAAAEAKGDFARALELYKKVAALGDTSKKAEAEQKVQEIEPKVVAK
jgi:predicted esterase